MTLDEYTVTSNEIWNRIIQYEISNTELFSGLNELHNLDVKFSTSEKLKRNTLVKPDTVVIKKHSNNGNY